MPNKPYNKAHFFFSISNQNTQFSVVDIDGQDDGLSSDYFFIIRTTTQTYIDPLSLIGGTAQLYWNDVNQSSTQISDTENHTHFNRHHGIISHTQFKSLRSDETESNFLYTFTLHSPLYPLRLQIHDRIFQNKNILEIIQEILNSAAWPTTAYRFNVTNNYLPLEYVTQFRQSDYDFIESLLTLNGLFHRFEQYEQHAVWIVYDTSCDIGIFNASSTNSDHSMPSPVTLELHPPTQLFTNMPAFLQWQEETQLLSKHICLSDNYYITPDLNLTVTTNTQSNIPGTGCIALSDYHYLTLNTGQQYADIMQQQLDWQRQIFTAQSNHYHLKPGQLIALDSHPHQQWNKSYRILSIQHQFRSTALQAMHHDSNINSTYPDNIETLFSDASYLDANVSIKKLISTNHSTELSDPLNYLSELNTELIHSAVLYPKAYYNILQLIPASENFRKPNAWCAANNSASPSSPHAFIGLMPATITADITSPYSAIDEYGRYTVQLPFAENTLHQPPTSLPIRFLQHSGGNSDQGFHYGWHFPLHANTPVALSFINGNINRPAIIGVIHYAHAPNPVNITNNTQNIWQTHGAQTCLFEERQGHAKIQLSTPQQHNSITLDATDNNHQLNIVSEQGLISLYAQQNVSIQAGDIINTQSGIDHQITVTKKQQLTTQNEDIQMHAGNNLLLNAQQDLIMQSNQSSVSMNSAYQLTIQAKGSYDLSTQQGDINISVQQGHFYGISPTGIKICCQGSGNIQLQQGESQLVMTNKGNITLTANTIKVTAPRIVLQQVNP